MLPRCPPRPHAVFSALFAAAAALALTGCGPPDGAVVTPEVTGGCETATASEVQTNEYMLPGRVCEGCHRAGGQATNSPFTIAGTVFTSPNSPCNNGGINGPALNPPLYVQVLDGTGNPQPNGLLAVNSSGNFYVSETFVAPIEMAIFQQSDLNDPTTIKNRTVMMTQVGYGVSGLGGTAVGCATCHQLPGMSGAPGRVYFTCADGVKDGTEADVDCGGASCSPCTTGKACLGNSDCSSQMCSNAVCLAP